MQNALDFCVGLFNPINRGVAKQLRKHLEGLDMEPFSAHCLEGNAAKDVASGKQTKQDSVVAVPSFFLGILSQLAAPLSQRRLYPESCRLRMPRR